MRRLQQLPQLLDGLMVPRLVIPQPLAPARATAVLPGGAALAAIGATASARRRADR